MSSRRRGDNAAWPVEDLPPDFLQFLLPGLEVTESGFVNSTPLEE